MNVLEEKGEWARIQTPEHYEGWVESSALVSRPGERYGSGTNVEQDGVKLLVAARRVKP